MKLSTTEQSIIDQAIAIIESKIHEGEVISNSADAANLLRLKLALCEHEVFAVIFLATSYKVIEVNEMFRGTIDASAVYPREVAKRALEVNAKAVILAHNHPSGSLNPSQADITITNAIAKALRLLDIDTLDHVIVTREGFTSFAERGLL